MNVINYQNIVIINVRKKLMKYSNFQMINKENVNFKLLILLIKCQDNFKQILMNLKRDYKTNIYYQNNKFKFLMEMIYMNTCARW